MKRLFTLAIAAFAICTMSMAAVTLPHTEGFEQAEGFPANFEAIGAEAWTQANTQSTSTFWNNVFSDAAKKNYTATIATPGVDNSDQCLKIVVQAVSFAPKTDGVTPIIRLRTASSTFNAGEKDIQVSVWAKVEGEQALSVVECTTKGSVEIGTEWTEYTIDVSNPNANGQVFIDFLPISTTDFTTANDYVIYMDKITFKKEGDDNEGGGDESEIGSLKLPYEDGFETANGFPSTFSVLGGEAWGMDKWGANKYTSDFWFSTFGNTTKENKTYVTSVVTEGVHGGSQALKIEMKAIAFEGGKAVRIKTPAGLFESGAKDVLLDFWARVDGDRALPVVKNGQKVLEIATTWTKYTMVAPISGNANQPQDGIFSLDFAPLSTEDFTAAQDYTIYFDDMRLYKDNGTNLDVAEANRLELYCNNKVVHFGTNEVLEQVQVFNTNGQLVRSVSRVEGSLNLQDMGTGLYIIRAQKEGMAETAKVLLK